MKRETIEDHTLSIDISEDGFERVIELSGELDAASVGSLYRVLQGAIYGDSERVVVDLSGLDFIDSSGIVALFRAVKDANANDTKLGVLRGPENIERVLAMTGVDQVLPFLD